MNYDFNPTFPRKKYSLTFILLLFFILSLVVCGFDSKKFQIGFGFNEALIYKIYHFLGYLKSLSLGKAYAFLTGSSPVEEGLFQEGWFKKVLKTAFTSSFNDSEIESFKDILKTSDSLIDNSKKGYRNIHNDLLFTHCFELGIKNKQNSNLPNQVVKEDYLIYEGGLLIPLKTTLQPSLGQLSFNYNQKNLSETTITDRTSYFNLSYFPFLTKKNLTIDSNLSSLFLSNSFKINPGFPLTDFNLSALMNNDPRLINEALPVIEFIKIKSAKIFFKLDLSEYPLFYSFFKFIKNVLDLILTNSSAILVNLILGYILFFRR